ncbi:DEAD/DEAH box helicase [Mammaliicoccus sciuri]|uniref:DEAD/DEAH box helicase n=1 Tax=Mammaliicoccus sciuri TaxID=1296 RepID=UPI003F549593
MNGQTELETLYLNSNLEDRPIYNIFREYSKDKNEQVYILNKPLLERNTEYEYSEGYFVLIPNHKIIFIDKNNNKDREDFEYYVEDILDDLVSIAKQYNFLNRLGRQRIWKNDLIKNYNEEEINETIFEEIITDSEEMKRKVNILISLLIGSINSFEKIGNNLPENQLDKIKQKIILFDGEQTRFIFEKKNNKLLSVQGLAGTGKTELLFHKLKELYLENEHNKIAFTCYNKILANSLKSRVPEFFSYMKVSEQIDWNNRLWVMPCWGSKQEINSGLYSYIVNYYGIEFNRFSNSMSFKTVCSKAIEQLKKLSKLDPCFDYILIDESQDFPEEFFELCKLVTSNQIIKVGDIFQNINDNVPLMSDIDILLNRCYRTDNRTLMFSHGFSLGLFEQNLFRWFTEEEWKTIGYKYELLEDDKIKLSRTPTRRLEEEVTEDNPFVKIVNSNSEENLYDSSEKVLEIIREIYSNNPTVQPNDIAIVYLDSDSTMYKLASNLDYKIRTELNILTNIGYDSKKIIDNRIFITNKYNIKGLEFPFVICIANKGIQHTVSSRNTVYMAMTRSFISSYLILNKATEEVEHLKEELRKINETNALVIDKPTNNQIESADKSLKFKVSKTMSLDEVINEILTAYKIADEDKIRKIKNATKGMVENSFEIEEVEEFIKVIVEKYYEN